VKFFQYTTVVTTTITIIIIHLPTLVVSKRLNPQQGKRDYVDIPDPCCGVQQSVLYLGI
jgi:hypothetical protein